VTAGANGDKRHIREDALADVFGIELSEEDSGDTVEPVPEPKPSLAKKDRTTRKRNEKTARNTAVPSANHARKSKPSSEAQSDAEPGAGVVPCSEPIVSPPRQKGSADRRKASKSDRKQARMPEDALRPSATAETKAETPLQGVVEPGAHVMTSLNGERRLQSPRGEKSSTEPQGSAEQAAPISVERRLRRRRGGRRIARRVRHAAAQAR
jgi:hypothetical protein